MLHRHMVKFIGVLSLLFYLLPSSPAMSIDIKKPASKEFFLGYGCGDNLKNRGEYVHHTLSLDLNYPFDGYFWRYFQFQLEPFVSFVSSPENNGEIGCAFFIKYTVPWDFPLKPYVRAGSGVILITQESEEQTSGFNFANQVGCGISYALPEVNISLEYRIRHISNAGIREPNSGIDDSIYLLGIGGSF
jgi:hypothetical protein